MPAVPPQTLALWAATLYCFAKAAYLTGSYRASSAVAVAAARVDPGDALFRPLLWLSLPCVVALWAGVATVADLPCAPRAPPSTIAVWVVAALLPAGMTALSPLVVGFVAVCIGVNIWSTTTSQPCLMVAVTAMLLGSLSALVYIATSKLADAAVAAIVPPVQSWGRGVARRFRAQRPDPL